MHPKASILGQLWELSAMHSFNGMYQFSVSPWFCMDALELALIHIEQFCNSGRFLVLEVTHMYATPQPQESRCV